MLRGLLWVPRLKPKRGGPRMRQAQALLLSCAAPRPGGGAVRRPSARIQARLRAWAAAPKRPSPLAYAAAAALAPWAPRPWGPGQGVASAGLAALPRAPRRRLLRPTRRPAAMALRLALLGGAGGLGTPAPRRLHRRWNPSPLGDLAWGPFRRR